MYYLLEDNQLVFPHPSVADEDGLLAVGGDLSVDRLILAYENGIFPWYSEDSPILWYAPLERFILSPAKLNISKSLEQIIKSDKFKVTFDQDFSSVISNCARSSRKNQQGT